MSRRLCPFALTLSTLSLLLLPPGLQATLYVEASDAALARRTPVIAEVTVLRADPSPASGRPATDYAVQLERLLQGAVGGSTLIVRVPGGAALAGTSGPGLKVWGAPSFGRDERCVLFLAPNADGSYRVVDLALGAFHEVDHGGRRLALRDLSEMTRLLPGAPVSLQAAGAAGTPGGAPAAVLDVARDLERFAAWLVERARGGPAPADYEVALGAGEAQALAAEARAVSGSAGQISQLHASGAAGEWAWTSRNDGQPEWPDLASVAALAAARAEIGEMEATGAQQDFASRLRYGGIARSAADLASFDGENTVLLAGPAANPELAPAFDCKSGGLVAVAGSWTDAEGQVLGGGVIFAAGAACLLAGSPAASAASMLGHELQLALLGSGAAPGATSAATPPTAAAPFALAELATAAPGAKAGPGGSLAASTGAPGRAVSPAGDGAGAAADRRRRKAGGSGLPPRGYQARGCGFDRNRNGIFGEAADCNICNGSTGGMDAGVLQNQVYVSCNTGTDSAACGTPGHPCRTINYAWNNRTAAPGTNAEDIICFRGTCHEESIMPGVSGKPGFYLKPQTGSEARSFQLPTHPTMLVGWDYNHNGLYPPYDTADEAVLEGTGLAEAIRLSYNSPNSYVELAHFTVRNYGSTSSAPNNGFITMGDAPGSSHHVYVHDISLQNVNAGKPLDSGNILFNFFTGTTHLQHVAFENIQIQNAGGYVARGNGPSGDTPDTAFENGPYRFERISLSGLACNAGGPGACGDPQTEAHVVGWKLWGYITGVEVLDSVLRLNPTAWTPYPSGFGSTAFVPAQCSRGWTIRNNEIDDFKVGLTVQGYATGFCDGAGARPVDGVTFDRNVFRNTYAPWTFGNNGVVVSGGGPNPRTSVGQVVVSDNDFSSTPGWQGMAYIDGGNGGGPDPGNIRFTGNTTFAPLTRSGFGAITIVSNNPYLPQTYSFHDNIIAGTGGGQENVHAEYAPGGWDADGNVFDPTSGYTWNHSISCSALGTWQSASRKDLASRACTPRFANAASGDFHVMPGDTCAGAAGTALKVNGPTATPAKPARPVKPAHHRD
jgi:hypothetical protein